MRLESCAYILRHLIFELQQTTTTNKQRGKQIQCKKSRLSMKQEHERNKREKWPFLPTLNSIFQLKNIYCI